MSKPVAKMTVLELKSALEERGLDTTGLKAVLVARLNEAVEDESQEGGEPAAEETAEPQAMDEGDVEANEPDEPEAEEATAMEETNDGTESAPMAEEAEAEGGADTAEVEKEANGEAALTPQQLEALAVKENRRVFVGSISSKATEEDLRAFAAGFGDLEDCTVPRHAQGGLRGFGFVTFTSKESADKFLEGEHTLKDQRLNVKIAVSKNRGRPEQEHEKKLFVTNLPKVKEDDETFISKEQLKEHFGQYGNVVDVVIMNDRTTGACRGFSFVAFENKDAVAAALKAESHAIGEVTLSVKRAEPKPVRAAPFGGAPFGGRGGYRPPMYPRMGMVPRIAGRGFPAYGRGYNMGYPGARGGGYRGFAGRGRGRGRSAFNPY